MAMSAEEINHRAVGELAESAGALRVAFMRDSLELTKELLNQQESGFDAIAVQDYPEGSVLNYWVLEDEISLPFIGEEPQSAITSYIAKEDYGLTLETKNDMMIFVPVEKGTRLDESLNIDDIKMPDFIAIRRGFSNGSVAWYIVRQEGVIPYVPEYESGGETKADEFVADDITDELIHRELSMKVDTGIGLIGQIREDFVNFDRQIQRKVLLLDGKYTEI